MGPPLAPRNEIWVGGWIAVLAAVAFGVTTPIIRNVGQGIGPATTAALLYAGAALATVGGRRRSEAPVRRAHVPRLVVVGVIGALLAPVCLAWGLQRSGATAASLLLNFEAVFTVLLARALYREPIGARVGLALVVMLGGGALVVLGQGVQGGIGLGLVAIVAATFFWALDNTVTRPLADLDPALVVRFKASIGSALSVALALGLRERLPAPLPALALLGCGAVGYGVSLRLYLLAQRRMGAARTGSIFALAPFIGAAVAWVWGDRTAGGWTLVAAFAFGVGLWLHLTEKHRHAHIHEPLQHEHAHSHDDAHHDHVHDPPVIGVHSHMHRHEPKAHDHPHAPDAHHHHAHE